MERLTEDLFVGLNHAVDSQGDASTVDADTAAEAALLRRRLGDGSDVTKPTALPFIWGSIRILSVYGKWSWWRKSKKTT